MEILIQDLRYVVRQLRSRLRFTGAALVTLGLGIGVTSAVFSAANWLLLRPVPGVHNPTTLVTIEVDDRAGRLSPTSYPNLADLRSRLSYLSGMAGFKEPISVALFLDGRRPLYAQASLVSANFFAVLGTRFALGRAMTRLEELEAPQVPVAVVSHRFWSGVLGGDSALVGRHVTINGLKTLVVGITERGFEGPERLRDVDIWVAGSAFFAIGHLGPAQVALESRAAPVFTDLVGRLAPGATAPRVQTQLRLVVADLAAAYPNENGHWEKPTVFEGIGVPAQSRSDVRRAITLLGVLAGLVLLIACLNVGNLSLFRGLARHGEWSIRQALGAPAARLIRLQLTESVLVSSVAAAPALLLSLWLTTLFRGSILPGIPGAATERVPIDWRVIVATLAIALTAGVVSGLIPAVASLRSNLATGLHGIASGQRRVGVQLRDALATLQLGLCLSLLIVTLLVLDTLRNLQAVKVGFDADRVSAFRVQPAYSGYTRELGKVVLREGLARVQSTPGVEAAALAAVAPFSPTLGARVRAGDAPQNGSWVQATGAWVSPTYFRTLGIPLVAGGTFEDAQLFAPIFGGGERVVILTESLARRVFGVRGAVGRTVFDGLPGPPARVIGVVADSRWASLANEGQGPLLYSPLPEFSGDGAVVLVRSTMNGPALHNAVQAAINEIAPSVPVQDMERLRERINDSLWEDRLLAQILTLSTVLAVLLATIGLYAVVAFSVAERTREIGIRVAIGARSGQLLAMVLRRGAVMGVMGIGLGLVGGAVLSRLVASRLYGIGALSLAVYGLAAGLVFVLVLVASLVPARHATRVEPITALRTE